MRRKNCKRRCEKRTLSKSKEVCRFYDAIQSKYADILQKDKDIEEICCNVPLEGLSEGEFTSDFFVCKEKWRLHGYGMCTKKISPKTYDSKIIGYFKELLAEKWRIRLGDCD